MFSLANKDRHCYAVIFESVVSSRLRIVISWLSDRHCFVVCTKAFQVDCKTHALTILGGRPNSQKSYRHSPAFLLQQLAMIELEIEQLASAWLGVRAVLMILARAEVGAILKWAWDFSGGVHVSPILDRPSVTS
jgi:hypothetical protein